jgi:hypothetical protein
MIEHLVAARREADRRERPKGSENRKRAGEKEGRSVRNG